MALVYEDVQGNYAFDGIAGDRIDTTPSQSDFTNNIGLSDHSPVGSEYAASVAALLFVFRIPMGIDVHIHADCIDIVDHLTLTAGLEWERNLSMLVSLCYAVCPAANPQLPVLSH